MDRNEFYDYEYLIDYLYFLEELVYIFEAYSKGIIDFNCLHLIQEFKEKRDDLGKYLNK